MFHDIPQPMLERMRRLEAIDSRDRGDGTPRLQRLRQIPPETGRFLAMLAAGAPPGAWVEIGTSAGYSTLWLALAAETFRLAGVSDVVELVHADARLHLQSLGPIGFCFLDAEKDAYLDCYEAVVPRLVAGGLLVADNAINHADSLKPMLDRALSDERVDALVVPIGKGELVCRRL